MKDPTWMRGPGGFFARHAALYRLSLAASSGAMVAFAAKVRRSRGPWGRLGWGALATLQGPQILGIWWAHRRADASRG